MMKKLTYSILLSAVSLNLSALEAVSEGDLRDVTGQDGIVAELNYKGTVGRAFFSDNGGNTVNLRNISIDSDGSNGVNPDRPIELTMDLFDNGFQSGMELSITDINDLDIRFEQLNVNGDQGDGALPGQANSYGGLALNNVYDHGGETVMQYLADGASGQEGIRINTYLAETFSFQLEYTDYGVDQATDTDDHSIKADVVLNNFVSENTVDLTTGTNFRGEDIGGLHIGVVSLSGDITIQGIQAGSNAGSLGRVVLNNYQVSPESYLTVQGKN